MLWTLQWFLVYSLLRPRVASCNWSIWTVGNVLLQLNVASLWTIQWLLVQRVVSLLRVVSCNCMACLECKQCSLVAQCCLAVDYPVAPGTEGCELQLPCLECRHRFQSILKCPHMCSGSPEERFCFREITTTTNISTINTSTAATTTITPITHTGKAKIKKEKMYHIKNNNLMCSYSIHTLSGWLCCHPLDIHGEARGPPSGGTGVHTTVIRLGVIKR